MITGQKNPTARAGYYVTTLIIVAFLGSATAIRFFIEGAVSEQASQVLNGFGIFMATVVAYSLLERWRPGGPHKSARAYALNQQVNILYSVTGACAGALAGLLQGISDADSL